MDGGDYDFGVRMYDSRLGRWLSLDRKSGKCPYFSPYSFAGNNPLSIIDINGDSLYILVQVIGYEENDMFEAATLTRQKNTENSPGFNASRDKVVIIQVTDVSDIKAKVAEATTQYSGQYGKTVEFGVWSHAGIDGPIGSAKTKIKPLDDNQMELAGWGDINFNWEGDGSKCRSGFYGCNTAKDPDGKNESFASQISKLSNFKNVTVSGQTLSSYPSRYTNYREHNLVYFYFIIKDFFKKKGGGLDNYPPSALNPSNSSTTRVMAGDTYMVGVYRLIQDPKGRRKNVATKMDNFKNSKKVFECP